jgi:hypothetical protein
MKERIHRMLYPSFEGFGGDYDAKNSGLKCGFEGVSLNTSLTYGEHGLIVATFTGFTPLLWSSYFHIGMSTIVHFLPKSSLLSSVRLRF